MGTVLVGLSVALMAWLVGEAWRSWRLTRELDQAITRENLESYVRHGSHDYTLRFRCGREYRGALASWRGSPGGQDVSIENGDRLERVWTQLVWERGEA